MWLQKKLKLQFVFFVFLSLQLATNFTRTHVTLTLSVSVWEYISSSTHVCVCTRSAVVHWHPDATASFTHVSSRLEERQCRVSGHCQSRCNELLPLFCCNLPPLALLLLFFQCQFKLLTHLFRVADSTLLSGRAKRSWRQCYRHHRTCGLRISGSLSADSYLNRLSLW